MESAATSSSTAAVIAALGGYTIILTALLGILGRIWIMRIIEREKNQLQTQLDATNKRLQASIDRGLHIDKAQFETEFSAYKNIWASLVDLRRATLQLRPSIDFSNPNEPKEDRLNRRLREFAIPFNGFQDIVEKNKPFYALSVYKHLTQVLDLCYGESIDTEYHERPAKEYYSEARENREKILIAIDATCEAIRERINEVRVG